MSSEQTIVLITGMNALLLHYKSNNTGANRGIGYETAKNLILHSATYHILLGSRSLSRGASAASDLQ
jgi:hypothetical protein